MEHEPELKDEMPLSRVQLSENSVPADIPLFSSTPGGVAVLEVNVKGSILDPVPTPFAQTTLPPSGDSQPGCVSSFNSTTVTMVTKLTASIDSIVTKSNLPPLDVLKFSVTHANISDLRHVFMKWLVLRQATTIVRKACVDALIDGPNISNNDGPGLRKFADHSRTLYETKTKL